LSLREFQVKAVAQLVFHPKICLFLIWKTGEGISAVVITSAMLLCSICLVIVPLLGLGCDQVAKGRDQASKSSPIIQMRTGMKISWLTAPSVYY
jgi:hypothetical protein